MMNRIGYHCNIGKRSCCQVYYDSHLLPRKQCVRQIQNYVATRQLSILQTNYTKNQLVSNKLSFRQNHGSCLAYRKPSTHQTHVNFSVTKRLSTDQNNGSYLATKKHSTSQSNGSYLGTKNLSRGYANFMNNLSTSKLPLRQTCNFMANRKLSTDQVVSYLLTKKPEGQVNFLINHLATKEMPRRQICNFMANRKLWTGQTSQMKIGFWPKPDYRPMEVFRSDYSNGIRVAAAKPTGGQMGACTIMFRAGSRCERDDELGASHFLRVAATLSGHEYSGYMKSRYLQQYGAYLTTSSDRQTISFTLRCPVTHFGTLKHYLLDTAKRCKYYDHELADTVKPMVRADLERIPMEEHCMDLVQQACWAGPLNNSIYCTEDRIDGMSQKSLLQFTVRNFKTSQCSIGSCGLLGQDVAKLADHIECGLTEPPLPPCEAPSYPRAGYECYDYGEGDTYIALAVPTCNTTDDLTQQYCYALLAETLGACAVQSSSYDSDRVPAPPLGRLRCEPFSQFRAFNISYGYCGMFGILVKTSSNYARDAAYAAAKFFSTIDNITHEQVCVGKKRLRLSLLMHDDDCVSVAEGMALQGGGGVHVDDASASWGHIDGIPTAAVIGTAQKIKTNLNRMAMAVVGDVEACPNDQELIR